MTRPPRQIVSADPVIGAFAEDLRALRTACGRTLHQLSLAAHYSISTLSEATNGKRLPTWELTSSYVRACGGDLNTWRTRWKTAAGEQVDQPQQEPLAQAADDSLEERAASRYRHHRASTSIKFIAFAFVIVVISLAAMVIASTRTDAEPVEGSHPSIRDLVSGHVATTAAVRWYSSGVFLGAASTFGVLGALVTSRAAVTRRVLTCHLLETVPHHSPAGRDVQTAHAPRHAARRATDPQIVRVKVANRSRRDIPSRAFDQHRPLRLDVAVPVLEVFDEQSKPRHLKTPRIKADGTAVNLGPDLIRGRQTVIFSMLVDGPDLHLTVPEPSVIDTRIRSVGPRAPLLRNPIIAGAVVATVTLGSTLTSGLAR